MSSELIMSCDHTSATPPQTSHAEGTYFIVHTTTMNVALMRADFGDVILQQLARREKELSHRAFRARSGIAFDGGLETEHDGSGVFVWRADGVLFGCAEDHHVHAVVAVGV